MLLVELVQGVNQQRCLLLSYELEAFPLVFLIAQETWVNLLAVSQYQPVDVVPSYWTVSSVLACCVSCSIEQDISYQAK